MFRILFLLFSIFLHTNFLIAKQVQLNGINFEVEKNQEFLACLKPLEISGFNKIYIKNTKDEPIYLIELNGSYGNCSWYRDQLVFDSDIANSDIQKTLEQYPIKLYLNSKITLKFTVKKLKNNKDSKFNLNQVEVPYFLVISNKKTEDILFQKDLIIKLNLTNKEVLEKDGNTISINLEIPLKDYLEIETLTGIYVKN